MSIEMTEEIKRWTAKRKSALVLEIIQGKTTVSEASRQYDLTPSEIEDWVDHAKAGKCANELLACARACKHFLVLLEHLMSAGQPTCVVSGAAVTVG